MNKINKSQVISSSEISNYCYCKAGWWLSRGGNKPAPEMLSSGVVFHKEIAERIKLSRKLFAIRAVLIIILFIGAVLWFWSLR